MIEVPQTFAACALLTVCAAIELIASSPAIAEHFESDRNTTRLAVGEMAPEIQLRPLRFYDFKVDQREITRENAAELYDAVRLSDFRGVKPVALLFGGDSTPDASTRLAAFQQLHETYHAWMQFLFVYSVTPAAADPPTDLGRMRLANTFVAEHEISAPCLVDDGVGDALRAYRHPPRSIVLVDKLGRIAHIESSGAELRDFERAIRTELSRGQAP